MRVDESDVGVSQARSLKLTTAVKKTLKAPKASSKPRRRRSSNKPGWDKACLGAVSHPTDGLLPLAYVGCGLS